MVETAVYAQWIPRLGVDISYANWRLSKTQQGEVDIVGMNAAQQKPFWAVEIKWTDRYTEHPEELTPLLYASNGFGTSIGDIKNHNNTT